MTKGKKLALTIILIAVAAYWMMFPLRVEILTPRLGIPVITQAGERIQPVIKTSLPFFYPAMQWRLSNGENQYPLQSVSSHSGLATKVFDLQLPDNIPNGAYSLIADSGGGDFMEQRKTVHVIDSVPDDFSIVQLADLPTLGGNESGDALLQQIISEINIINPNVVLFTGDIAYGGGWDQYRRLIDSMAKVDAPVIAVAGNHEYEGWAGYLHYFVEPYHIVDYGPYAFISLNSGHSRDQMTQSQLQWLRKQFRQLQDKTPIVQIHHPVHHDKGQHGYVHVNADKLEALFKRYGVPIVLSGHWHGDMVFDEQGRQRRDTWDFPGTPYVTTTTAGADLREDYSASPLHHGYRLIRLKNTKLQTYTYDYDGDGQRDAAASIPVGKLNVTDTGDNTITIRNDLNESLPNAKVTISVAETPTALRPTRGKIVGYRELDGKTLVDILVDLPANSKTTISLEPKTQQSSE
jgi:predicted phosphodiesterase